jgi:hypothetical protein
MDPAELQLLQWSTNALGPTSWVDVLLNFAVAIIYGFFISMIYRQCSGLHANRSFIQTLYMLSLIITMIMMIILNVRGVAAVAVAFGMMGALSIIRFRTVVKDNRDTAFVFLAVAGGMGAGTGKWSIGFIGLALIGMVLLIIAYAPWGASSRHIMLRVTSRPERDAAEDATLGVRNVLAQLGTRIEVIHVRTVRQGELLETTYEMRLFPGVEATHATTRITAVSGVDSVSIFSPDQYREL